MVEYLYTCCQQKAETVKLQHINVYDPEVEQDRQLRVVLDAPEDLGEGVELLGSTYAEASLLFLAALQQMMEESDIPVDEFNETLSGKINLDPEDPLNEHARKEVIPAIIERTRIQAMNLVLEAEKNPEKEYLLPAGESLAMIAYEMDELAKQWPDNPIVAFLQYHFLLVRRRRESFEGERTFVFPGEEIELSHNVAIQNVDLLLLSLGVDTYRLPVKTMMVLSGADTV